MVRVWSALKPSLICERDLEWTKTILDCVDGMRDLDEELLAREYTEIVFEENCPMHKLLQICGGRKMKSILERRAKVSF